MRRITDFRTFNVADHKYSISRQPANHHTPKQFHEEMVFPVKGEMERAGNPKKCIRLSTKRSDLTDRPVA